MGFRTSQASGEYDRFESSIIASHPNLWETAQPPEQAEEHA